jgi:hypothetical protein
LLSPIALIEHLATGLLEAAKARNSLKAFMRSSPRRAATDPVNQALLKIFFVLDQDVVKSHAYPQDFLKAAQLRL